jgi:myosin heavy subunit
MLRISKTLFAACVAVVLVVGAGYSWYRIAYSKCRTPIKYDIGTIDGRFKVSPATVRSALSDAESLWEDATGKNLFTYVKGASLKVNFVYDTRQQETEKQHTLTTVLDKKAAASATIKDNYDALVQSYTTLKTQYEQKVGSYDKRLKAHNTLVADWNTKGGAPAEVYAELQRTSNTLSTESASLNTLAKQLNDLGKKINQVGESGNAAVRDYNSSVNNFNEKYDHEREFTQGDYTGTGINVYQYDDEKELRRVLAHELGHALSLGHVADQGAIMHSVMEGEHPNLTLKYDDLAEYKRVCGVK